MLARVIEFVAAILILTAGVFYVIIPLIKSYNKQRKQGGSRYQILIRSLMGDTEKASINDKILFRLIAFVVILAKTC